MSQDSPLPKRAKVHTRYAQRIAEIIEMLHDGKTVYTQQLAQRYRTSERTIQRDLNNADRITLPLERTKDGGYRLKAPNGTGKFGFTELQRFAELTGVAGSLPSMERTQLARLLDPRSQPPLEYRSEGLENARAFRHLFELLEQQISQHQMVQFDYKNKTRRVAPYRLIQNHGSWYLAGLEQDILKIFRLSLIQNAMPDPDQTPFEPQADVIERIDDSAGIWFASNPSTAQARLQVAPDIAAHFRSRELLPNQRIVEEQPDGQLIIETTYHHPLQILPIIRYWIPHVQILQPSDLQQNLVHGLQGYLQQLKPQES